MSPLLTDPNEFAPSVFDDFDAEVTNAWYGPYKSPNSTTGKYQLFGFVEFTPDEESGHEPFVQRYRAGFLNGAVPSVSGNDDDPAGNTFEFYLALAKGEDSIPEGEEENYNGAYTIAVPADVSGRVTTQLPPSDLGQFLKTLDDEGFKSWDAPITCIVGVRGHFNRLRAVNQMPAQEGQTQREWKVLCCTKYYGSGEDNKKGATKPAASAKGAAKPAATTTTKSAATKPTTTASKKSSADDEMETLVRDSIIAVLGEMENPADKRTVCATVLKDKIESKNAGKAIKFTNSIPWMTSQTDYWVYDTDDNTLTLVT